MGGGRNFSRGWPLADLSKSFSSMQLEKVSVILWFRRLQPLYYVLFSLFLSTCVLQNVWVHTMDFVSAHKLEQVPTWNKKCIVIFDPWRNGPSDFAVATCFDQINCIIREDYHFTVYWLRASVYMVDTLAGLTEMWSSFYCRSCLRFTSSLHFQWRMTNQIFYVRNPLRLKLCGKNYVRIFCKVLFYFYEIWGYSVCRTISKSSSSKVHFGFPGTLNYFHG